MLPFILVLQLIDYIYRTGLRVHCKQPDASFIPVNIQIPHSCQHPNSSRQSQRNPVQHVQDSQAQHSQLSSLRSPIGMNHGICCTLRDARVKAFSNKTSEQQLVVGIKLFKNEFSRCERFVEYPLTVGNNRGESFQLQGAWVVQLLSWSCGNFVGLRFRFPG